MGVSHLRGTFRAIRPFWTAWIQRKPPMAGLVSIFKVKDSMR